MNDLPSEADLTNSPNNSTRSTKNVTVGVDAGTEDGLAHSVLLPVLGSVLLFVALCVLVGRWYCCKLRRAGWNGLGTRRGARRGRRIPTTAGGGRTSSGISTSEIVCTASVPQQELAEATGDRQTSVAPVPVNSHHLEEAKRSHHLANVPSYTTDTNMGTAM